MECEFPEYLKMTWLADLVRFRQVEILDEMVEWVVTYPLVLPDPLGLQAFLIVSTLNCRSVVIFC